MDEPVSATDANRYFSALIRGVQHGQSYVVTSHGRPVARIIPVHEDDPDSAEAARARVIARLQKMPVLNLGPWSRENAYDEPLDENDLR